MAINQIIRRIEKEIKSRGWTKKEFCDLLGISTQNYNNWRTRGIPEGQPLYQVAKLLGWNIESLLSGMPEKAVKEDVISPYASPHKKRLFRLVGDMTDLQAATLAAFIDTCQIQPAVKGPELHFDESTEAARQSKTDRK